MRREIGKYTAPAGIGEEDVSEADLAFGLRRKNDSFLRESIDEWFAINYFENFSQCDPPLRECDSRRGQLNSEEGLEEKDRDIKNERVTLER